MRLHAPRAVLNLGMQLQFEVVVDGASLRAA